MSIESFCQMTVDGANMAHAALIPYQVNSNPLYNFLAAIPEALLALVQIVGGIAIGLIFGPLGMIFQNESCGILAFAALDHLGTGLAALMFSISNLTSFGLVGSKLNQSPSARIINTILLKNSFTNFSNQVYVSVNS